MKDSCHLIQDLYPLYVEDELSPSVKKMVEEHLEGCPDCSLVYESGEGFTEELEEQKEVPKTLDDRVKLKLKFRRMKFIAVILAVIIAGMLLNKYENSRQKVFSWSQEKYREAEQLTELVESTRHEDLASLKYNEDMYFKYSISDFDAFNWLELQRLEKTVHHLRINTNTLYSTLETLHHKQQAGNWDDVDARTYSKLKEYSYQYLNIVGDQYQKFHHGYSSYLELVDFEKLDQRVAAINELSYHYNRFHKLPEDVDPMSENKLKKRIGKILNVKSSKVEFTRDSFFTNEFGIKGFEVGQKYHGDIDVFTGTIMDLNASPMIEEKGEGPTGKAKEQAEQFLKNMLGEKSQFKLTLDPKSGPGNAYVYRFKPLQDGYHLLDENENLVDFRISISKEHGTVNNLMIYRSYLGESFFEKEYKERLTPEQGLDKLNALIAEEDEMYTVKRKYEHTGTFVILSSLTGDYELVHAYDLTNDHETRGTNRNGARRYINAESGNEELHYEMSP